ncbi:MAG: J domain-containing protein [Chloroflexi bacterium]|nr:J domain-containing protein [Chloroflexota bacterium]
MAQNYYDILGIGKGASDKEIKSAYRKKARKLHPDVNPNDASAEEQFKKVNEAYEVLGDAAHRKDYDQFGENWKHADQMRNMGGGRGPGGMGFDMSDLFGGAQRSGGFGDIFGGGHAQQRLRHEGSIDVSLDEVYTGVSRRVSLGSAMNGSRTLEVKIPKGVPDGRRIRLRPDTNTELTLTVNVRPDPRFTREDANLRTSVSVPLLNAILGGEVEVPTMTGRIALQIPSGTQNGRSFKIKGRGLPKMNSEEYGDLYATVKVSLPESLSARERELYAELRDIRMGVATSTGAEQNSADQIVEGAAE